MSKRKSSKRLPPINPNNTIQIEEITFDLAFSEYKRKNLNRAVLMKDEEAIRGFVKKKIPTLSAKQVDFYKILDSF